MGGMIHDATCHPRPLDHTFPGPDLATAPTGFGATAPPGGQTCELLAG